MPFYVIRRRSNLGDWTHIDYVSKGGGWDQEFKRARVFSSMGAVKNSIMHWHGTGDNDAEIVELELAPTGKVITVGEAMAPLKERRERQVRERRDREAAEKRDRELAELKRLKEKYRAP